MGKWRIENEIDVVNHIVDIEPLEAADHIVTHNANDVNDLLALMYEGTRKIEAIKLHRKLTAYGLKESKDEIEKYWTSATQRTT